MGAQMGEIVKLEVPESCGRIPLFPVYGAWFNLQDLRFFTIYFVAFSVSIVS
jgi:hypothetical protein